MITTLSCTKTTWVIFVVQAIGRVKDEGIDEPLLYKADAGWQFFTLTTSIIDNNVQIE